MAFVRASDETGSGEFVVFPNGYSLLKNIKESDLVVIGGLVTKRYDSYQINVNGIQKVVGD